MSIDLSTFAILVSVLAGAITITSITACVRLMAVHKAEQQKSDKEYANLQKLFREAKTDCEKLDKECTKWVDELEALNKENQQSFNANAEKADALHQIALTLSPLIRMCGIKVSDDLQKLMGENDDYQLAPATLGELLETTKVLVRSSSKDIERLQVLKGAISERMRDCVYKVNGLSELLLLIDALCLNENETNRRAIAVRIRGMQVSELVVLLILNHRCPDKPDYPLKDLLLSVKDHSLFQEALAQSTSILQTMPVAANLLRNLALKEVTGRPKS